MSTNEDQALMENGIAVIGMSGRFPGARTTHELWENVQTGIEAISFFSDEELLESGVCEASLRDPNYIKARATLSDADRFDAAFFGYSPTEAQMMDPQQRLFLEHAFEALDGAGYSAEKYGRTVGVFAGSGWANTYFVESLLDNEDILGRASAYQLQLSNGGDFLTTRVSYKLGLGGPSVAVQTACSTSLVAVCMACHSLLTYHCDMALAGGVAIRFPQRAGYIYQEGMILSPDGHCRAFDAEARGTVSGSGVGVVLLKRFSEALKAGDTIHAVIRGSAINNDGASKVGFTAPSVEGQANAIAQALAAASVSPDTIRYIEAHGTGTPLGDPIEIAALTKAFRAGTRRRGFCAVGSIKANIGHLDAASGVSGLLHAIEVLKHKKLPPLLHFKSPNPAIDFASTPFYVNTAPMDWSADSAPRRAGVSSFGMGGTNAHVILEEAPPPAPSGPSKRWKLLTLSAKTNTALENLSSQIGAYLAQNAALDVADAAFTLSVGRRPFAHRRAVLCTNATDAAQTLATTDPARVFTGRQVSEKRSVIFMFPGQGSQRVNMAAELYHTEAAFRAQFDQCAEILTPALGKDLRSIIYPPSAAAEDAARALDQTAFTQPALVALEIALARLWMSWGVRPQSMIGHSIGEYTAACIAGVFSLQDALLIAAARGRLMQSLQHGAMISVVLGESEAQALLTPDLSLAAVNGPSSCVISGPLHAVGELEKELSTRGIGVQRLRTSHAFHSSMMEPVLAPFLDVLKRVKFSAPAIPYLSNVTGAWVCAEEATSPDYWARQLRHTVRFADGLLQLFKGPEGILLEVGPGTALSNLARRNPNITPAQLVLSSLEAPSDPARGMESLMGTLGVLWAEGVSVDWESVYRGEQRHRVLLPTYPFERQRYWIDPPRERDRTASASAPTPMDLNKESARIEKLGAFLEQDIKPAGLPGAFRHLANRLCTCHIYAYLRAGGVDTRRGSKHTYQSLLRQLRVMPKYEKFLMYFLKALGDDEMISMSGDTVVFTSEDSDVPPPSIVMEELCGSYPQFRADFELLAYCAGHYGRALSGDINPIEVLHPDGGGDLLAPMVKNWQVFSHLPLCLRLAGEALSLIAERSSGRTLKILEIGGGDGLLTWLLVPSLRGRNVEYTFTDIGNYFVIKARRRAAELGVGFMNFGVLDISSDTSTQGYAPNSFDVVLAFNVLHATKSLETSIHHVKNLLAPNGVAVIVELTRLERWHAMIWGFEEGLWYFADEHIRAYSPILHAAGWEDVLRRQGFEGVHAYPQSDAARDASDHAVILAQKPPSDVENTRQDVKTPKDSPGIHRGVRALNTRPSLKTPYAEPRSEIERTVTGIWEHVLGMDCIGVHDNFFELGGDSLIAVQLIARLRQSLQRPLDQHSLLSTPTIAGLCASLEVPATPAESASMPARELSCELVELRRGGSAPPLFLVHPAGGHVYIYRELALSLPEDQPIYAIKARGLDALATCFSSIEEMAAHYVNVIRAFRPEGPYYLGGSSFGGVVVYEMAQILTAQGHHMPFLGLLDAGMLDQWPTDELEEEVLILSYFLGVGAKLPVTKEALMRLGSDERLRYFLQHGRKALRLPPDFGIDELRPLLRFFRVNVRAMKAYKPAPYPGRITFLRARERDTVTPLAPEVPWVRVATGGIDIFDVDGNHITMHFHPHVAGLAQRIAHCIDYARRH